MAKHNYYVLRDHEGGADGRTRFIGGRDRREADESDVAHLVEMGVLSTSKPEGFGEAPAAGNGAKDAGTAGKRTKAEGRSATNKSSG